ncbi:MAG: cytochrome C551 [Deltaproteobacteria bacterium CG2_30_63_29]|nr:MAG: cytochrome C551 [Deltaproteobacteria bacterium CG2_30_63_29]PIV98258.1 MAG: cytochrome C551 [Deltaproteobacteria bacterium CG17_big_fil_post_rev_8_21_14_2_50_63_7]PJB39653.1 MAG: cytochrome C551 [Deltaproteobacteria bacterium CG_4_9_14_3_um_filter_63_12]
MADPKIAAKFPAVLELKPGTYHYCACGESKNQPFCDGSHKGTAFTPMAFELETEKKVAVCQCKHSGKAPFCDGTHKKL